MCYKEKDLISVIVVSYNSKDYILECLESIYNQTYQNIELIITDDSSKDETLDIVREWTDKTHDRFLKMAILSSEINTGVSGNCNRGIFAAHGKWVKLIAADDILLPTCLSDSLRFAEGDPLCKVLFSDSIPFRKHIGDVVYKNSKRGLYFWDESKTANDQLMMLLRFNRIIASGCFMQLEIIKNLGGFDESIPNVEDIPMWIKMTHQGYKLYHLNSSLTGYRLRDDSLTGNTVKYNHISINQVKQYILISEKYRLPLSRGINAIINKVDYYLTKRKIMYYNKSALKFKTVFYISRFWSHSVKFLSLYIFKS